MQVVGRVHKGLEILEKVNESAVDPDDLPLQRITITSCGLTDAQVYTSVLQEFAMKALRTPLLSLVLRKCMFFMSGHRSVNDRIHSTASAALTKSVLGS